MSCDFSPISTLLKNPPESLEALNAAVTGIDQGASQELKEVFMKVISENRFACGGYLYPGKFKEAVTALVLTTQALDATMIGDRVLIFIASLSEKVAQASYPLLAAMHIEEAKTVSEESEGKSNSEKISTLVEKLKADEEMTDRVFLRTDKKTQEKLSGNGGYCAPAFLDRCSPKLLFLDLSTLWIKYVLPSIGQLTQLRELDLSNNYIERLPDSIGNLKSLRVLNIQQNELLKKLPDSIGGCKNLMKLLASKTRISSLPESMRELKELKEVDIENTAIDPNKSDTYISLMKNGVTVKAGGKPPSVGMEGLTEMLSALQMGNPGMGAPMGGPMGGGRRPMRGAPQGVPSECLQQ